MILPFAFIGWESLVLEFEYDRHRVAETHRHVALTGGLPFRRFGQYGLPLRPRASCRGSSVPVCWSASRLSPRRISRLRCQYVVLLCQRRIGEARTQLRKTLRSSSPERGFLVGYDEYRLLLYLFGLYLYRRDFDVFVFEVHPADAGLYLGVIPYHIQDVGDDRYRLLVLYGFGFGFLSVVTSIISTSSTVATGAITSTTFFRAG